GANSGSAGSSFPHAKPIARSPLSASNGRSQRDAVPDASRADHSALFWRCAASSVLPKAFGESINAASLKLLYNSHSSDSNGRIEGTTFATGLPTPRCFVYG